MVDIEIQLNGRVITTNSSTLYELCRPKKEQVVILNGFQINENKSLKSGDSIFIIEKGIMPNKTELEAMLMARHTPTVHNKVRLARVVVLGLGGLGSSIAIMLARTGVGTLHLIDFDIVEPSNLNRQQYKIKHLGMLKTKALSNEISEINPYINIVTDNVKLTEDNLLHYIKDDNIICEAFDNPECKAMAVNLVLENCKDKYIIASSGMAGLESSNTITTKKLTNNFYLCGDGITQAQEGCGLMAPRVGICAGHMANMVLRILTGEFSV